MKGAILGGLAAWSGTLVRFAITCAVALLVLSPTLSTLRSANRELPPMFCAGETLQAAKTALRGECGKASFAQRRPSRHGHHTLALSPSAPPVAATIGGQPAEHHAALNVAVPVTRLELEPRRPPRA